MKVLVTGGAGYVGSHVCKALARRGHAVAVVDDLRTGHADAVRWGPLIQCDVGSASDVQAAIAQVLPDAVVHMSGSCYVGESVENPRKYHINNTVASEVLLQAMQRGSVRRLVFSSSCAVYGVPSVVPIDESCAREPINPYGRSKRDIEVAVERESSRGWLSAVTLRYFNAAGADPDGEIGERHDPETHLIPIALQVAAGLTSHLRVFGDDHPTPDGSCIRDYVHVSDLAEAHVAALEHLGDGGPSATLNLGTGHGYSVLEVVDACRRVTGRHVATEIAPRRQGDPPELVACPARALALLGWTPRHSDIDSIIRTAWHWIERTGGRDAMSAERGAATR